MQDYLSVEAWDDVEEESPRFFVIAVGSKEIEWARVSVEKGEVKEREFKRIWKWWKKKLNTDWKKLSNLRKFALFLLSVVR